MVSVPTFDLNRYHQDFKSLVGDEVYFPLRHRAVSQLYPPGSTIKPLVALAALGDGFVNPDTTFNCTGYFTESDPNHWRCWTVKHGMPGHGPMNVYEGLKNSCNIYFYHLGQGLGAERLAYWLSLFITAKSHSPPLASSMSKTHSSSSALFHTTSVAVIVV